MYQKQHTHLENVEKLSIINDFILRIINLIYFFNSYQGAWWYNSCYYANLNGLPIEGKHDKGEGINWYHWLKDKYSLMKTTMMIKPAFEN